MSSVRDPFCWLRLTRATSLVLTAIAAVSAVSLRPRAAAAGEVRRPNVIVILTDDQRFDYLSVAGHPYLDTPHLDQLAADGVRFTNAYVTTSICSVSRACILTGQHSRRHGIEALDTPLTPEAFSQSYAGFLRSHGYRTGHVGKWHLGQMRGGNATHFDDWRGFEGWAINYFVTGDDGKRVHLTRKHGNDAVALLKQYAKTEQPFCLNLWFQAPHGEHWYPEIETADDRYRPDPELQALYENQDVEMPASFDEFERSIPEVLRGDLALRDRWRKRLEDPDVRRRLIHQYCRLIKGVDLQVGRVRDALERLELADDTIIIFLSDNGYFLGEHGLAGKFWPHEPSSRIPMIVFDPRQPKDQRGREDSHLVLNIDVAPTLLEAAGISAPRSMQGRSLMPLLERESVDWRDDFYYRQVYQAYRTREDGVSVPTIPACEGVIGNRYKYFRFIRARDHQEIEGEWPLYEYLFDMLQDPLEHHNLAGELRYLPMLQRLRARTAHLEQLAAGR